MADDSDSTKTGRPRKSDGPKVPYDEIDKLPEEVRERIKKLERSKGLPDAGKGAKETPVEPIKLRPEGGIRA